MKNTIGVGKAMDSTLLFNKNTTDVVKATMASTFLFKKNTTDVVKATMISFLWFKGIAGKNGLLRHK